MSAIVNPVSDASDLEKAASSPQNNSTSAEPQQTPTPLLPTVAEGVNQEPKQRWNEILRKWMQWLLDGVRKLLIGALFAYVMLLSGTTCKLDDSHINAD